MSAMDACVITTCDSRLVLERARDEMAWRAGVTRYNLEDEVSRLESARRQFRGED